MRFRICLKKNKGENIMYKRYGLILLAIMILNTACVSKRKELSIEETNKSKKYVREEKKDDLIELKYGVKFRSPSTWKVLENLDGNIAVLVPEREIEKKELNNYFIVKQEDVLKYDTNLESYYELMKEQINENAENVYIEYEKTYEKNSSKYMYIEFTGKEKGKTYQGIYVYTKKNNRIYTFAAMSKLEEYRYYEKDINLIIETIEIDEVEREKVEINPSLSKYDIYKNTKHGFSLKYPRGWQTIIEEDKAAVFTLYTPQEDENDKIWENISVNVDDLSEVNISIEEYADIAYQNVQELFQGNLKLLDSERIILNEKDAFKVLYGVKKEEQELLFMQIYLIEGLKGYVLNFSSTIETYGKYKDLAKNVFNSFEVTKAEETIKVLERELILKFRNSEYESVIDYANKILEKEDGELQGYFYRAEAYRALDMNEKAFSDYRRMSMITDRKEYLNKAYAGMASLYFSEGAILKAEEYFLKALEYGGSESYINYVLASIYFQNKEYNKSIDYYSKVIEIKQEESLGALLGRSDVYYSMKEYEKAYKDLSKIIELNPKVIYIGTVYNNRACNLRYMGESERAMIDIKMALEIDPENAYVYTTIAELYADMGDKEKFFEYIKKAESLDSEIVNNLYENYTIEDLIIKDLLDEYKKMETE